MKHGEDDPMAGLRLGLGIGEKRVGRRRSLCEGHGGKDEAGENPAPHMNLLLRSAAEFEFTLPQELQTILMFLI